MKKILLLIFFFVIFSCTKVETPIKSVKNNEIESFLNQNSIKIHSGEYKGLESLGIREKQKEYDEMLLQFFFDVLNENSTGIEDFMQYQLNFMKLFPIDKILYFHWIRDNFDLSLFNLLKDEFGNLDFDSDFYFTYFQVIPMEYLSL